MPTSVKNLKKHLAGKNLLSPSSLRDRQHLADEIAAWFETHARDLPPLTQIDLLREFTYDQGIVFESWTDADKLRWLISLIGRLVSCDPLADKDWSPPVQFRVKSLFDGIDRLGDYVLLYEAFIHFHFVAVASQFIWMTRDLEEAGLPPTVALGQKIVHAALTDRKCMGGRVWLHRAGGISRAAHDLLKQATGSLDVPLAELFDLLEPQTLDLHPGFGNGPGQDQIVRTGGLTFGLFALLQQVRNTLMAHADDVGGEVEEPVARGLWILFGAVGRQLAPYQRLGLAVTGYAEQQLVLKALWDADGNLRQPQNNASRVRYFVPIWGASSEPQAPFVAPTPPRIEGWSWEDSLLLFDRAAPRTRYLYLMPMGYRYAHEDGAAKLVPGLLDSVIWRKIAGTQRTSLTLIQRKYLDRSELANDWHDAQDQQTPRASPAHENVRALVERIAQTYHLDFQLPEGETAAVARIFDLRHGQRALQLAQDTVPRAGEVDRIFTKARDLIARNSESCVLLLVIGPSGIGKSVLLAQMYARVSDRALFFTMDNAPEPEYEVIPATRKVTLSVGTLGDGRLSLNELQASSLDGDRRERSLGVPVRMHWLAGARSLAHKPAPISLLEIEETQRQIAALLQEAVAESDPLYIFIDAVNQAPVPESLLQGFKPFSRLPANVVLIASTQDNETVLARLTDNGRQPWEKIFVDKLAQEQTRAVFLQGLQAGSPPTLSDGFIRFVHERSRGLPLLVRYWGERFAALWQTNAATAERALQGEFAKPGAALLPRTYFDRLKEASRDFVPVKLPEALLWCLSLVNKPLGTEQLTQAVARIRALVEDLPAVSKADVDAAITRLSGYLQAELAGFERLWRLAHPVIGEAWLDYFGTRERIAAINEALLPFGAMPRIETWAADRQNTWMERLFTGATEYERLEVEQRRVLADGLLAQLEREAGLQAWRHRRAGLMVEQGWLLHQMGQSQKGLKLAEESLAWSQERLRDSTLSASIRADLQWDAARANTVTGIIEWSRGQRASLVARFEEALTLRQSAQNFVGGWTRNRARALAESHQNLAITLAAIGERDEAITHLDAAIAILENLDSSYIPGQEKLANAYDNRGYVRNALGQREAALADYDRAIELYEGLDLGNPDYRNNLALAHLNRGIVHNALGQREAALADYDRAIELYEGLDLGNPDYRNNLASSHHNRGIVHNALGQREAALADYDRAIELYEGLDLGNPDYRDSLALAHLNRGIVHNALGQREAALADYDRAIELREGLDLGNPDYRDSLASSHHNRGIVHNALGQREAALADYDRAIELREGLDLGNPDYRNNLASSHLNRGNVRDDLGQREAALADYDRAIELYEGLDLGNPDYRDSLALAHLNRGNVRDDLGQREAALADYDRAIELYEGLDRGNPEYRQDLAHSYHNRGWVREALIQREAALADYDRAIELREGLDLGNPEYRQDLAQSYHNRGNVRNALGQREAALADYDRAIELREGLDLGNPKYRIVLR
ncbi:MAG: tetratricopeptide repeat protein [Candidatus Competibacteraceae bacterium]